MKKLLSLLSVLTISGTAAPSVIAASSYHKQEQNLENSEINYLQTNNLEKLNRNKREIKYSKVTTKLYTKLSGGNLVNSGVVLNNKFYFLSSYGYIIEYNLQTSEKSHLLIPDIVLLKPSNYEIFILNNKLYLGLLNEDNKTFYEYNIQTKNYLKIENLEIKKIKNKNIQVKNKEYFFKNYDSMFYEKNMINNKEKIIIDDIFMENSILLFNNNLYLNSINKKVYEYNLKTGELKTIIESNNAFLSSPIILNNKIYFIDREFGMYEYKPLELYNYDNNVINLEKIIKTGIYSIQLEQNSNFNIENISNINLENLKLFDVFLTQEKTEIKKLSSKDICGDIGATFKNPYDYEIERNTISCSKKTLLTTTIQKLNGFSKTETKSDSTNNEISNSKADKKAWGWSWNAKIGIKASGKVGIPLVAEGELELSGEIGGGETRGEDTTYTGSTKQSDTKTFSIGDTSNTAYTEINTETEEETITIVSQKIKIPPHETINFNSEAKKITLEFTLHLNQKVSGIISTTIIKENNGSELINFSIKDIMASLEKNNLLNKKITINNDNTISFLYDVKVKKEILWTKSEN